MRPADTDVETTLIVIPPDTNPHGTAFGGWIMSQMDLVAAICTTRFTGNRKCVTAHVDDLQFNIPINLGEIITLKSRVNWVGKSSLEIGVKVVKDNCDSQVHCLSGFLTFVNIGDDGKPCFIPRSLTCESVDEHRRWADAEQRRKDRLARRR